VFFNILNNVLYNKKVEPKILYDGIEEFSPFMLNRWCSMYSGDMCNLINVTTNKLHNIFEDKITQYKLFMHIIPRQSRKRINYLKKTKPADKDDDAEQEMIDTVARELELSRKEISMYIQYEREHRSTDSD